MDAEQQMLPGSWPHDREEQKVDDTAEPPTETMATDQLCLPIEEMH